MHTVNKSLLHLCKCSPSPQVSRFHVDAGIVLPPDSTTGASHKVPSGVIKPGNGNSMKIHENPPFLDACPTKTSIYFRDVPAMFEDTGYHQFLTCVQLPRGQRRPPPSNPWSFEMPPATSGAGSGATGVNQSRPVTRVPHMYKLVLGSA